MAIASLRDTKQEALRAIEKASQGNIRARAISGELVNNAFFLCSEKEAAQKVKVEADKYGALWFACHVHGVDIAEITETGLISYCLHMAYDAIVEVRFC